MDSQELKKEMNLSYSQLVNYLLKKYGASKYDYFCNESCRSIKHKVSRSSEGLICHHIDEDKAILLSNPRRALKNPFDYQKAERLVYCNCLEHLLLHVKIVEEPRNPQANRNEKLGIAGIIVYLCPQLNDFYNGYKFERAWEIKIFDIVKENFDDYILILQRLWDVIKSQGYTKNNLCRGWKGNVYQNIYRKLK